MKKALLLLLAFAALPAFSQKITEKALLGRWQMCALETSMGQVDFNKKKATLSDSEKKTTAKEDWALTEEALLTGVESFSYLYLEFKPNSIIKHNLDGEDEGAYSIFEKKGKQYLVEPGMPADSDEVEIILKNGKLSLIVSDGEEGAISMIFEPRKAAPRPAVVPDATKLTIPDLLGAWKMTMYIDEAATVDVRTDKITLANNINETHNAQELAGLKSSLDEMLQIGKTNQFIFGTDVFVIKTEGVETDRGDYFMEVDDKTYMQITYHDEEGDVEEIYEVYIKNNSLYMTLTDDGSTFVYTR